MINNLVYSGVVDPGRDLHRAAARAVDRAPAHARRRPRAPPARPAPRRRRTARRPAPPRSRSSPSCSSAARRTSSPARSTSRSATSRRSSRSPRSSARRSPTSSTYRLCRALRRRDGPERTERAGGVVRDAGGGYHGGSASDVDSTRAHRRADEPATRWTSADRRAGRRMIDQAAAAADRAGRGHRPASGTSS